eukprot:6479405-Amphidinium_carterae.1
MASSTVHVGVELTNAVGSIFFVFFISLVAAAVDAFVCYSHPSDSAGSSVVVDPSVRCWEDVQHTKMVMVATLSFCFVPANFLAVCVFAVLKYPRTMSTSSVPLRPVPLDTTCCYLSRTCGLNTQRGRCAGGDCCRHTCLHGNFPVDLATLAHAICQQNG